MPCGGKEITICKKGCETRNVTANDILTVLSFKIKQPFNSIKEHLDKNLLIDFIEFLGF